MSVTPAAAIGPTLFIARSTLRSDATSQVLDQGPGGKRASSSATAASIWAATSFGPYLSTPVAWPRHTTLPDAASSRSMTSEPVSTYRMPVGGAPEPESSDRRSIRVPPRGVVPDEERRVGVDVGEPAGGESPGQRLPDRLVGHRFRRHKDAGLPAPGLVPREVHSVVVLHCLDGRSKQQDHRQKRHGLTAFLEGLST